MLLEQYFMNLLLLIIIITMHSKREYYNYFIHLKLVFEVEDMYIFFNLCLFF